MDFVERIETTRFLGAEFLVWLWFCSEIFDTRFDVGGKRAEIWLDSPLSLESQLEPGERITLRGVAPASAPEAKEALRQNKLPTKARLVLRSDPHEFAWMLDAATLGVSSASVPAVLTQDAEEGFLERMELLGSLGDWLDALFARFVHLRLASGWTALWVPAMASWMHDEPLTPAQLRKLTAELESQERSAQGRSPARQEPRGSGRSARSAKKR